jgi:hypothetical protein
VLKSEFDPTEFDQTKVTKDLTNLTDMADAIIDAINDAINKEDNKGINASKVESINIKSANTHSATRSVCFKC